MFKEEVLAFRVGLGKAGYISSRTKVVDAGVSKCSLFIVQGLHSVGKERAKVWPGVFDGRLFVPRVNLQGELWEQLHVVNAGENCRVHVEGKLGIALFFDAVILAAQILVDCICCVVGSIKDGSDFDAIGSVKRGETFLEGLQNFKSQGLISMPVIGEEVSNNGVCKGVDDVKDTRKIGVPKVRVVGGGLVVFGLSVVNFSKALSFRRLKYY